jgi:uncharacterized protein (DUF1697 family)
MSMGNLATIYIKLRRWKEAEELSVQVMETRRRELGQEHPHTLISMGNLAVTFRKQGRLKGAEELEVKVMEAFRRVLGHEHPHTLTSMSHLAATYTEQGKWKEAEELQIHVTNRTQATLGEDHPSTVLAITNLASLRKSRAAFLRLLNRSRLEHELRKVPEGLLIQFRERLQQLVIARSLDGGSIGEEIFQRSPKILQKSDDGDDLGPDEEND